MSPFRQSAALALIRLIHTAVWAALAACILAIPAAALENRFRLVAALTVIILAECAVLALNGGTCPLTALAARYTRNREPNFDIYLPLWLARHNKTIFGSLFFAGELFALARWLH